MTERGATVTTRWGSFGGFVGDVSGVLAVLVFIPVAMLIIGTPLVLLVRLVIEIVERL